MLYHFDYVVESLRCLMLESHLLLRLAHFQSMVEKYLCSFEIKQTKMLNEWSMWKMPQKLQCYQRQHYIMPLGSFSEDPGECSFDKNHTELGDVQERMSRAGVDKAKEL